MYQPSFRTKKNAVPIMRKAEIDFIAEQYILDFKPEAMKTPMEIDIDDFALNYLGLKQDFQLLSHNGVYLGMIVFNHTNKVIVYDSESNQAKYISAKARTVIIDNNLLEANQEHRYRYTMGHESGHDIFHKAYFGYNARQLSIFDQEFSPLIQCRAVPSDGKVKPVSQWNDKDSMEWQANYLSSALLMPRKMVKMLVESLQYIPQQYRDYAYIQEVVQVFNVSQQAALYRLKALGIVGAEVECQEDGQVYITI